MVPATSLVEEKQRGTDKALTVTPLSLGELFVAKGLLGFLLSLFMGVVILILNNAFGARPGLLLLTLALGAVMASTFGIILGAFIRDINTLFATVKGIGILLYAPALVYLFPEIPAWIGQLFPTYYMIEPVIEIAQEGAGWAAVAPELIVMAVLNLVLIGAIALIVRAERTGMRLSRRLA
jgi:ABC-2 type transport system permease protein